MPRAPPEANTRCTFLFLMVIAIQIRCKLIFYLAFENGIKQYLVAFGTITGPNNDPKSLNPIVRSASMKWTLRVMILFILATLNLQALSRPGKPRLTKAEKRQRAMLRKLKGSDQLVEYNQAIHQATEIGQYLIADSLIDRSRYLLNHCSDSLVYYEHQRLKARLYTILIRYPEALRLFKSCLLYYQRHGRWNKEGLVTVNLIEFYRSAAMYREARKELKLLINSASFEDLSTGVKARAYHRFAAVLNESGGDLDSVIMLSQQSLAYSEPDSLLDEMATSYLEIGYAYAQQKQSRAIYYFRKSAQVFKQQSKVHYYCNSLVNIASYYMRVRANKQALAYLDSAISYAQPYSLPGFKAVAYEKLAKTYARLGNPTKAYVLRDSSAILFREELQSRFSDNLAIQSRRFKTEIAESRMRAWESERRKVLEENRRSILIQRIVSISLISLILVLIAFYYFYSRLRRGARNLEISEKALYAANEELLNTLEEKDGLIEEVHHRVKNNLQLISSLIRVQQFQHKGKLEPEATQMVDDILNRVTAMAVVHEKLYTQQQISQLRAREYFEELIYELQTIGFQTNKNLVIEVEAEDVRLNTSHGIALGMICTELVANSMKYAFKEQDAPRIMIKIEKQVKRDYSEVRFNYRDNGPGFKKNAKLGMGNRLILLFCRQLEGKYSFETEGQFGFNLTYREE